MADEDTHLGVLLVAAIVSGAIVGAVLGGLGGVLPGVGIGMMAFALGFIEPHDPAEGPHQ